MANQKITALTATTTLAATDILPVVTSPGASPTTKKITQANLAAQVMAQSTVNGRLTLTTATPITSSDVTAATTLYFTPYLGDKIGLFDGTYWQLYSFTEKSLNISSYTANKNYDIFGYASGGTLALEGLVWTNDTTRATALTTQNGILVKSGSTTRRYLGTIRITGTTGQCEDSLIKRYVWNMYNRVPRPMYRQAAQHTYDSATYRTWNNDTTLLLEFVLGQGQVVRAGLGTAFTASANGQLRVIMDIDDLSATNAATYRRLGGCGSFAGGTGIFASDNGQDFAVEGYHYFNVCESSNTTATNTFSVIYMRGDIDM